MAFFRFIPLKWPFYSRVPYILSSKQADVFAFFFFLKYNKKHVFCPSSATKHIHGSSSWKVIHLKLGSQISNWAASHLASGASHQLREKKITPSLSLNSDINLSFHLSEENETITNHCLFRWQLHAYDKVIFPQMNYSLTLVRQWLIKLFMKLLKRVVPVPTVCHCCRQVTVLEKNQQILSH